MIRNVDCNIEFAHIYDNQSKIGNEQIESIKKTISIVRALEKKGDTYSLCVMIDEYNPKAHVLDIDRYLTDLEKKGAPPSYFAYESRMVYGAPHVLKSIPKSKIIINKISQDEKVFEKLELRGSTKKILLEKNDKFSCPLLIAIWNLYRLGAITYRMDDIHFTGLTEKKPFIAKKIINILPQKYMKVELYALEILNNSKYRQVVDQIEHIYF